MIEKFLDSISLGLYESLKELKTIDRLLLMLSIMFVVAAASAVIYIYKQNRADAKANAEERKLSKDELITVYKEHSTKMENLVTQVVSAVKDNTESNKAIVSSVQSNNELIKVFINKNN